MDPDIFKKRLLEMRNSKVTADNTTDICEVTPEEAQADESTTDDVRAAENSDSVGNT